MFLKFAAPIIPKEVYESGKKLNLGSGRRYLPGYVNIDISPERRPDIVALVDRLDFFKDEEYDLVRASHILEHFPYKECGRVLREWNRVLKPGGYLVICVPDYIRLSWRAILYPHGFDPCFSEHSERALDCINGLFALKLPPQYRHQTVFTRGSLSHLLLTSGFSVVGRQIYQVEHPYILGISDDSCTCYSLNLVSKKNRNLKICPIFYGTMFNLSSCKILRSLNCSWHHSHATEILQADQ